MSTTAIPLPSVLSSRRNAEVGLAIAVVWFHNWSHRPGREALARRVDDFLGGDSLRRAREQLEELARFERE